jgi:hypothetical protein
MIRIKNTIIDLSKVHCLKLDGSTIEILFENGSYEFINYEDEAEAQTSFNEVGVKFCN